MEPAIPADSWGGRAQWLEHDWIAPAGDRVFEPVGRISRMVGDMINNRTAIAIIDSDDLLRARLPLLLGAAGLTAKLFESAR